VAFLHMSLRLCIAASEITALTSAGDAPHGNDL
jgi:hypothetical protein